MEVGINRAWNEDLYLILAGIDDANGFVQGRNPQPAATFRILVNPLVPWIWAGGMIIAIGTLIALWPSAPSVPAPTRVPERVGRRAGAREREELAGV